jgi:hypothetical protein
VHAQPPFAAIGKDVHMTRSNEVTLCFHPTHLMHNPPKAFTSLRKTPQAIRRPRDRIAWLYSATTLAVFPALGCARAQEKSADKSTCSGKTAPLVIAFSG